MQTKRVSWRELTIYRIKNSSAIQVTLNGKPRIRTAYPMANDSIYFYVDNVRYQVSNASDMPELDIDDPTGDQIILAEKQGITIELNLDGTVEKKDDTKHPQYSTIKTCVQSDIPVYLKGPAGSGKNYTLQEIAEELDLTFYFTNSVQQEYKITGFIDAGGVYHTTEFRQAFEQGGLFFLDEIDASIPEVLVLLNAAIANRYFEFPDGKITAHEDFRVVAAGNTVGSGADELYTGRLQLDQATLDRFVIIEFDYYEKIELSLAEGDQKLVNFTHLLRRQANEKGMRTTFSYRMIINVVKLQKSGISKDKILEIAVFKGLDLDTVKTFKMDMENGSCGAWYYAFMNFIGKAPAYNYNKIPGAFAQSR